jgi:hypothetical protein
MTAILSNNLEDTTLHLEPVLVIIYNIKPGLVEKCKLLKNQNQATVFYYKFDEIILSAEEKIV